MNLENKNILLTGGSSGIGKATAQILISKGAKVVITGRNKERLEKVAAEIGAIPLVFDVADLASIPSKAKEAVSLLGGAIDTLINNAGIGVFPLLGAIKEDDFYKIFTTNVFGLGLLTQEITEIFKAQNFGNIINIGSTAAQKGFAMGTVYAASKFAVRGMTQSWQAELRKYNIRVCLVNPSEVTTAFFTSNDSEKPEESNKLSPQEIAHTIVSTLEMRDKGFVPEVTVWATNPF